jgi:hypothetical protein
LEVYPIFRQTLAILNQNIAGSRHVPEGNSTKLCEPYYGYYWQVSDWDEDVISKATANPKMLVVSSNYIF